jgi:hypothetical protein
MNKSVKMLVLISAVKGRQTYYYRQNYGCF